MGRRPARLAATTEADQAYIASLMTPVRRARPFAGWIAPPARGINGQPVEFEYVRLGLAHDRVGSSLPPEFNVAT